MPQLARSTQTDVPTAPCRLMQMKHHSDRAGCDLTATRNTKNDRMAAAASDNNATDIAAPASASASSVVVANNAAEQSSQECKDMSAEMRAYVTAAKGDQGECERMWMESGRSKLLLTMMIMGAASTKPKQSALCWWCFEQGAPLLF